MWTELVQLVIGGVLLGGIYGLAAFGLSISFGVMNILNLAHGEFLMLGALAGYAAFVGLGLNPFVGAVLVIPPFAVIGAVFYHLLIKPISHKPGHELLVASVLVTLGASLIIEDLTAFLWDRPLTGISYSLPATSICGVTISSLRLLVLLFITILASLLQVCIKKTLFGHAVRAITQCREGARIVGIDISRVSAYTFGLGISLAAAAGVFYAALFSVVPSMGIPLTVKYLCVVVLGGLGSLWGSVAGGLLLGLAEVMTAYWIGAQWSPCVAFGLLIGLLVVRPQGLFGRA